MRSAQCVVTFNHTWMISHNLLIDNYTYHLPCDRIARFPLTERGRSKLLVYRNGTITDSIFTHLPHYISKDDLLVFNNTRVIRARIEMEKETGAHIEIFCLEPYDPADYRESFSRLKTCQWKCLVGNLKKWKSGVLKKVIAYNHGEVTLQAERLSGTDNHQIIRFGWDGDVDFGTLLDLCGHTPIPPYLNRKSEEIDDSRYQTVYSKHKGSVAAPTAGLHFTPQVMQQLSDKGIQLDEITLHVGAGTFRPVQQSEIRLHEMHEEFFSIDSTVIHHIIANGGIITAVGTTSLRALESIYWLGVKILYEKKEIKRLELQQWEAYSLPQDVSMETALQNVYETMKKNGQNTLSASTKIMIIPGYQFRVCRRLITNFHQPQSTLLLLVGAFTGNRWKDIYQHALEHDYRFLSYGDSSLLELAGASYAYPSVHL